MKTRPIRLKPRVLKETGRVGYGDVVHQLPRGMGIRECIVARPGRTMITCDWEGAELVTHAQNLLHTVGKSKMADALNNGIKVHDMLGARIAGCTYEHMVANRATDKLLDNYRQSAKPANFGFPGLMGALTLVFQQRKQGPDTTAPNGRVYKGLRFCLLAGGESECGHTKITNWKGRQCNPVCKRCVEVADILRDVWFESWPENHEYFEYVQNVYDSGEMVQHYTGRVRGKASLCATANGLFQGLAGDAMKIAVQRMSWEMYCDKSSDLYGARLILPVHDEAIADADDDQAHEAAMRIAVIMRESLHECCPDMGPACKADPALMKRWHKGASPVYSENGRLIPWEPN